MARRVGNVARLRDHHVRSRVQVLSGAAAAVAYHAGYVADLKWSAGMDLPVRYDWLLLPDQTYESLSQVQSHLRDRAFRNPCSSAHACAAPEGRAHGADTCACAGVPACAAAGLPADTSDRRAQPYPIRLVNWFMSK